LNMEGMEMELDITPISVTQSDTNTDTPRSEKHGIYSTDPDETTSTP
jgi:hypothetical protein